MHCTLTARGILIAALVLFSSTSYGQSLAEHPRVREAVHLIETWLDAQQVFEQIPGLSAAVVHDQDIVWSGGFGHANRETETPATPETLYSICSISKLFTSVGVMQLFEQGRLRLDDPLERHLPWFNITRTDTLAPDITVQGLLTHSSGLPRESDHPYWSGPDFIFPTRDEIVDGLLNQETLYPADTYFQYSNLGLTLAGEIVAEVSGEPFDRYIRSRILEPLGMSATFTSMPADLHGDRLAMGYSAVQRDGSRHPVTLFQARGIDPAAGFASSVEDLARFASWQFRALDRKDDSGVLATNTLRRMHRVHWVDPDFETTWGLGFVVSRNDGKTFVGHGGSCPGYRAQFLMRPEEKIAVIFMANAQGVNASQFARQLYEIINPAIRTATKDTTIEEAEREVNLAPYTGLFASGFAGEIAIVEWEGALASVYLPTMNPVQGMTRLKHDEGHRFRRVRSNDDLGETIRFELGDDGRADHFIWHSNIYRRVRQSAE